MLLFLKGAGVVGSLLVIIALVITLLKALIGLIAFLGFAIKLLIVLAFLGLFAFVGMAMFRAWQDKQRTA
jgi:hypothetical protein